MANPHHYGLILAGGRGTRFWPRSRRRSAKQVLNVVGSRSLIQNTVARLRPVIPPERLWVLTNDYLRDEIVRQLPEVPARQILAEPAQRNTAPAIGLAAHILQSIDPEAVMGVFPADHIIAKEGRYRQLVRGALRSAGRGQIVVLGILPRWAETGYGYIEFPRGTEPGPQAIAIRRFQEKPDARTARRYVASGRFFWNAGMFFGRAGVLLDELRKHLPRTASILAALPAFDDAAFLAKLQEAFPLCENVSVDYAVMEKARGVVGVACPEIGWNDVGSWNAVYELLPHDKDGNTLLQDAIWSRWWVFRT
jgi:mannose-1-phosphate guanylyltransferase